MTPTETMQRIGRLTPLGEVLAHIDRVAPVAPRTVDLAHAHRRVLAEDAIAPTPVPLTAIALRDGWAVRCATMSDAGPYAPVTLAPPPAWVEPGAPLPHEADAVVVPDAVTVTAGIAQASAPAVPGEGMLPAGADAGSAPLRRAGECLRAIDLAVLRAGGIPRVRVREARVQVYCANATVDTVDDTVSPLLVRAIDAAGCTAMVARATPNGGRALRDILAAGDADAVIVIGGSGAGHHDASVRTLGDVGRVDIHGIGITPGETAAVGAVGAQPVLIVPGRLDAALAAFLMLGLPLLARLTGRAAPEPGVQLPLARKIASTVGVADVVPVARTERGLVPLASGHWPLQALARADGWVAVPPESEGYPAGATVEMRAWP